MRGSDRRDGFLTTDLLSAWTDPDTAMEAVGASLGIFGERVADARSSLATETPLRKALFAVLLSLVEGGVLEKRACSDGRYAFRWRQDTSAPIAVAPPTPAVVVPARTEPVRHWPQLAVATAPLVLPALSCLLAILAYVWLDHPVALGIAGALTLVGVIGLIRRVPFAGLWTMGVVVAGLVLRLS